MKAIEVKVRYRNDYFVLFFCLYFLSAIGIGFGGKTRGSGGALFADMPLPFPEESAEVETFSGRETEEREESGKSATNAATRSSSSSSSRIGAEEKKSSSTLGEGGEARASETISESQGDKNESEKGTKVVAPKGETTSVVSEGNVSQTRLPNSSKTSLKKKKDKKKEDPSESGYKRGVLRLRENQRNNAKSEFDQAGGQGKSSNAARLEGARLTAESSNDANTITEQIDSEEEKWKAVFEVARSLRGNGKTQEAEAQYLRLITEAPENFQTIALVSLGEMLSVTERKDSARRYLLQAIKLIRKKPELDSKGEQQERAVTLIARIYAEQGKYEEAENWAKAYLNRINPNAEENSPFVKELRKIIQKRNY